MVGGKGSGTPSEEMKWVGYDFPLVRIRACKRTEDRTFILEMENTDSFSDETIKKSEVLFW